MWTKGWRDQVWERLENSQTWPWDIIVIGGGITGAGIFREAARVGLRALLLEAQDFASGTSSRSSKLVHGGLRYLKNGQIMTTVASVHERDRLLKEGKGLVSRLGMLFVCFDDNRLLLPMTGIGLAIYDLLGLHWGHKRYGTADLVKLAPELKESHLIGGYRYFDAQTDDARLVLRVIREGVFDGGLALNYARVEKILRRGDGQVAGVAIRDGAGDQDRTIEVEGTVVVNATGAQADMLRAQIGGQGRLRCLRGSHLVFPNHVFPLARAVSFTHPVDRRPVFALPWEGVTLFGTTDVDHPRDYCEEPVISPAEVDYLLSAVDHAFPGLALNESAVQSTFAGVRAVVDTGKTNPSKESREHVLWQEDGLLTVTGGKLTTFRVMAHDALRAVRRWLPGQPRFGGERLFDKVTDTPGMTELAPAERLRLIGRYGQEVDKLAGAAQPGEWSRVAGSQALWAELRWAARAEGVVHLDDLLLRRVRLGLLLPDGGLPQMDRIGDIVRPELGWDEKRWHEEVAAYARHWQSAYAPPGKTLRAWPDQGMESLKSLESALTP